MTNYVKECLDNILNADSLPPKIGDSLISSCLSKSLPGLVLEFGVFTGGSLRIIANSTDKICYGFDTFTGLPESAKGWHKGEFNLAGNIPHFTESNVRIVPGLIQETFPEFLKEHSEKVSFVHIDTDIYSSAKYILDSLYDNDRFQEGTIILFDEIFNCEGNSYPNWIHNEYKAFVEFGERTKMKIKLIGRRHPHAYAFEVLA